MPNKTPLKPWEKGYCPSKLPREPVPKIKHKPDAKTRQGGLDRFHGKAVQQLPKETRSAIAKKNATKRLKKQLPTAEEVLQKKNFDPMAFLVDVAKNEALFEDHPFLPKLIEYLDMIIEKMDFEQGWGVKTIVDQVRVEAIGYLQDSYTPKDLRVNVAKELMQYTRPKLKQTEHVHGGAKNQGTATPLTEEEVIMFKKWFDEEF